MLGLLLLPIMLLWLAGCIALVIYIVRQRTLKDSHVRAKIVVGAILLASPFIDEFIGKFQFESLCRANKIENADLSRAKDKRVRVRTTSWRAVPWMLLPTHEAVLSFIDADSGVIVAEVKDYHSSGGWLLRYTWFGSGSRAPYMFDGNCSDAKTWQRVLSKYNITEINK